MSNVLTVFGATGRQGGSVIRTVLADPDLSRQFKLRGITRDASKPEAKALVDQGVEVVSADMTSVDSVVKALNGSHSVFLVTNPNFGVEGSEVELVQGKNVAEAAKQVKVQHLIFSSLLNITETTGGRLKNVIHFDQKAQIEQHIRSLGLPATFVLPGYFMTNYMTFKMLQKGDDGVYTLTSPVGEDANFPLIDIDADMGKYVAIALKNPSKTQGSQILASADYYTSKRILSEFEEVTGKKTRFAKIDSETYRRLTPGFLGLEMLENHLFIESPGYYNGRSLKESHDLLAEAGYKPTSWKEFVEKNKASFT